MLLISHKKIGMIYHLTDEGDSWSIDQNQKIVFICKIFNNNRFCKYIVLTFVIIYTLQQPKYLDSACKNLYSLVSLGTTSVKSKPSFTCAIPYIPMNRRIKDPMIVKTCKYKTITTIISWLFYLVLFVCGVCVGGGCMWQSFLQSSEDKI